MKRNELIEAMTLYRDACQRNDGFRTRGERAMLQLMIWYLTERVSDDAFKYTGITHYLPRILADAWECFRCDDHPMVMECRQEYLKDLERDPNNPIVDVLDIQFNIVEKALTISDLARIPSEAIKSFGGRYKNWALGIRHDIDAYFNAETTVLSKIWDRFLRQVYEQGLLRVIDESEVSAGMSGRFGNVELRSLITAGRIMFTLAKIEGGREELEESITFIGEEGDKKGYRFGIQSIHCDFITAMDMINQVIANWPSEPAEQAKIFTDNTDIGFGF